jgi:hypothetical protein
MAQPQGVTRLLLRLGSRALVQSSSHVNQSQWCVPYGIFGHWPTYDSASLSFCHCIQLSGAYACIATPYGQSLCAGWHPSGLSASCQLCSLAHAITQVIYTVLRAHWSLLLTRSTCTLPMCSPTPHHHDDAFAVANDDPGGFRERLLWVLQQHGFWSHGMLSS